MIEFNSTQFLSIFRPWNPKMAEKQVRKALSSTTRVSGMSQEDAGHPARVHEADKEQLVKHDRKDQARSIKTIDIWK